MGIVNSILYAGAAAVVISIIVGKLRRVRKDYQCYYQQEVQQYTNTH